MFILLLTLFSIVAYAFPPRYATPCPPVLASYEMSDRETTASEPCRFTNGRSSPNHCDQPARISSPKLRAHQSSSRKLISWDAATVCSTLRSPTDWFTPSDHHIVTSPNHVSFSRSQPEFKSMTNRIPVRLFYWDTDVINLVEVGARKRTKTPTTFFVNGVWSG
jgi:hypothetical protein